jgi:hypothetical protein
MTGTDANTQDPRLAVTTHPWPGVVGVCVRCLVVVSFMTKVLTQYRQAAPVEAK